jgi:hypothetical protein
MRPLTKNVANAPPVNPCPKLYAHAASINVAAASLQKFASVPPMIRAERAPQIAETAQNTVVRNDASMPRRACSSS